MFQLKQQMNKFHIWGFTKEFLDRIDWSNYMTIKLNHLHEWMNA